MMTFKRVAAIALAMVTLTVMNATVTMADDDDVMMTGTLVSVDGEKYTIRTAAGERIFKFKDGVPRPANLTPGTQVTMWVDEDDVDDNPPGEKVESETYTIHRISVGSPTEPPAVSVPPTSTPEPAAPAQPAQPTTPPPARESTPEPVSELPQTAGPLTVLGLVGFVALASGLGLTLRHRRRDT